MTQPAESPPDMTQSVDPLPSHVLLLARSAIAAAPLAEMERLRLGLETELGDRQEHRPAGAASPRVRFAFSEQGQPSFRDAMTAFIAEGCTALTIVPLMLPAEATFQTWITKTLGRWRQRHETTQAADGASPRPWPQVTLAPLLAETPALGNVLAGLVDAARASPPLELKQKAAPEGSLVPAAQRRVLVCRGGPCEASGAAIVWGHLRNEQERQGLRAAGSGMMSCATTCLGPCNLAPVVQVWPEGSLYGGIDEDGIDRIIACHLLGGEVAAELAYEPTGRKQFLRG